MKKNLFFLLLIAAYGLLLLSNPALAVNYTPVASNAPFNPTTQTPIFTSLDRFTNISGTVYLAWRHDSAAGVAFYSVYLDDQLLASYDWWNNSDLFYQDTAGQWYFAMPPISLDGNNHHVFLTVADSNGTFLGWSAMLWFDHTKPAGQITSLGPPADSNAFNSALTSISGTMSDDLKVDHGDLIIYRLLADNSWQLALQTNVSVGSSGTWTVGSASGITSNLFSEATYMLTLDSYDAAGNTFNYYTLATFDYTRPKYNNDSGFNYGTLSNKWLTETNKNYVFTNITFTDENALASMEVQATWGTNSSPWVHVADLGWAKSATPSWSLPASIWSYMREGTNTINVRVWDKAGNYSTSNYSFTAYKDSVGPSAPSSASASPSGWTSSNNFTVTWTNPTDTSDIDGFYYKLDAAPTASSPGTYIAGDNIHSYTSTFGLSSLSASSHTLYFCLKDKAGNLNTANYAWVALNYDNSAPSFSGTVTGSKSGTNLTFDWSGTSAGDSGAFPTTKKYYYLIDQISSSSNTGIYAADNGTMNTSATKSSAGEGNWYCHVIAVDAAGNKSGPLGSAVISIDTTAPTNPTTTYGYNNNTAGKTSITTNTTYSFTSPYFTWAGATDTNGSGVGGYYVYFGTNSGADPATAGTATGSTSYVVPAGFSWTSGSTYYLRIKTYDAVGNVTSGVYDAFTYKFDNTPPTVYDVKSTDGSYGPGMVLPVKVVFTKPVTVAGGTPKLLLETGTVDQQATYASGSGTTDLIFNYTVQAGDSSADLDYVATTSLALNGATIKDAAGNNAILTLATPGATHSLGANNVIVIDSTPPHVIGVSTTPNKSYKALDTVNISVLFNSTVVASGSGTPTLALETGTTDRQAIYDSLIASPPTLLFKYTVQPGDTSADLNYIAISSLAMNGFVLKDPAQNVVQAADLLLPAVSDPTNSLGASHVIIDTTAPLMLISSLKLVDPNSPTTVVPLLNKTWAQFRITASDETSGLLVNPKFYMEDPITINGANMQAVSGASNIYKYDFQQSVVYPLGNYHLWIVATDKAGNTTTMDATVQLVNAPPIITLDPEGDQSVSAGAEKKINVYATDPDGLTVTYTCEGLPTSATFLTDGAGGFDFKWTPLSADQEIDLGNHVLTFEASDGTLVTSETINLLVMDTRAIMTTSSISGTLKNGWYKELPATTLTRNKTGKTYYQWDSMATGGWTTVESLSVTVLGREGKHALYYYSVDLSTPATPVTETVKSTGTLKVDLQKPVSTLSVTPALPASGWYNKTTSQNLVVKLTATDPGTDSSGVNSLNYTLDGQLVNYGGSSRTISFNGDGSHTVEAYWADDLAGNTEEAHSAPVTIKIDTGNPVVTDGIRHSSSDSLSDVNTWYGANTGTFNVAFADAMSGIASVELIAVDRYSYSLGTFQLTNFTTVPWRLPDPLWDALQDGKNTITVRAWDAAGNKNETVTFVVNKRTNGPGRPTNLTATPAGWSGTNSFTINWTNPDTAGLAIAKAHYQLDVAPSAPAGAGAPNEQTVSLGATQRTIAGITLPSSGNHKLYLWLEDAVGNADARNYACVDLLLATPPTITGQISAVNKGDVNAPIRVGSDIRFFLTPGDAAAGWNTGSGKIWVRKITDTTWPSSAPMTYDTENGWFYYNGYGSPAGRSEKAGQGYHVKIELTDKATPANVAAIEADLPALVQNTPPRFTEPTGGSTITVASGTVGKTINVAGSDVDGGALTYACLNLSDLTSLDATFTVKSDGSGGTLTLNTSPNQGGTYPVFFTVTDSGLAGLPGSALASSEMVYITIQDKTAPTTTITLTGTTSNAAGWYQSAPTVSLDRDEVTGGATYYRIGGGNFQAYTGPFNATEGPNTINYYSVDASNNTESTKSRLVNVDSTPPAFVSGAPTVSPVSPTNSTSLNFSLSPVTFSDSGSSFPSQKYYYLFNNNPTATTSEVVTGGTLTAAGSSNAIINNVAEGAWYLHAVCRDKADNNSAVVNSAAVVVDQRAPNNPAAATDTESGGPSSGQWQKTLTNPVFTWTAAIDNGLAGISGYTLSWSKDPTAIPSTSTGSKQTATTYTPSPVNPVNGDGSYLLKIRTFDNAGNYSNPATIFTFNYDHTAPVVGFTAQPSASLSGPTLNYQWTGTDVSPLTYYYLLDRITNTDPETAGTSTASNAATVQATAGDGAYYFHLAAIDGAGTKTVLHSTAVTVDTVVPTCEISYSNNWQSSSTINLTRSSQAGVSGIADHDVQYRAAWVQNGVVGTYGDWTKIGNDWGDVNLNSFSASTSSIGNAYQFRYRVKNGGGAVSEWAYSPNTVKVDNVVPTGSVTITLPSGTTVINTTNVDLTFAAADAVSGVTDMKVSNQSSLSDAAWEPYQTVKSNWTLPAPGSGTTTRTVYAKFRDYASNESSIASNSIDIDTSNPTGTYSVRVDNGAGGYQAGDYTASRAVQIYSNITGASYMKVEGDIVSPETTFYAYLATKAGYLLTPNEGTKNVKVTFRDAAGNMQELTDTVTLDATAPGAPLNVVVTPAGWSPSGPWTITWTNPADTSGVKKVHYQKDGGAWTTKEVSSATLSLTTSDLNNVEGNHQLEFYLEDAAGNSDPTKLGTAEVKYDKTKPVARIDSWTKVDPQGRTYRLSFNAADPLPGSGVTQMRLRNNNSSWLSNTDSWVAYTSSTTDFKIDGDTNYAIWAQFQDGAGNISDPVSVTVNPGVVQPAPTVTAITPTTMFANETPDVTIAGTNFRAGATVRLVGTGNLAVNAISYQLFVKQNSAGLITAEVSGGVTNGSYRVVVTNDDGQGSADNVLLKVWDLNASVSSLTLTTAAPTTLYDGQSVTFTATALYTDGSVRDVTNSATFTLPVGAPGTISHGTYTALSSISGNSTVTLTATYGGKSATADITLVAKILDSISVELNGSPVTNVTVLQGLTKQFTVTAHYNGQRTEQVTTADWTVDPADLGTMDQTQNGKFSAVTIGTGTLEAGFGGKSALVTVNVEADQLSYVRISAGSAQAGNPIVFTVTGYKDNGTTVPLGDRPIYWNNSLLSGGATYTVTAPEQPTQISATVSVPQAGPASLIVNVEPDDLATLTISGADTVTAGSSTRFAVTGQDKYHNAIGLIPSLVWSTTQGEISTDGVLSKLDNAGIVTVEAKSGSVSAKKTLTVAGRYSDVTATVDNGKVVVVGKDQTGNPAPLTGYTVTYDVTGQQYGNKILSDGTFVPGQQEGSFVVTATVNADGRVYTTTTTLSVNMGAPRMSVKIDNQTFGSNLIISSRPQFKIDLTDGNGVQSVRVFIDGTQMSASGVVLHAQNVGNTAATTSFTADSDLAAGEHTLLIEAEDSLGVKGTVSASGLKVYADLLVIGRAMTYPNPFKPGTQSTTINYTLTKNADVKLMISDLAGRQIYGQLFLSGALGGSAGENEPTWDGKDFNGRIVPNGVYVYFLISNGKSIGNGEISVYE